MPSWKLLLATACLAAVAGLRAPAAPSDASASCDAAAPVVVFLTRHAEKASAPPKDPPLTDAGAAHARALRDLLGKAKVTHLFATEFVRTQQTLAPLAETTGLAVTTIGAAKTSEQVAALRALPPGSVAVVAGHSNTLPAMVRSLGGTIDDTVQGKSGEQIPDDEYGRLIELILPPASEAGAGATAPTLPTTTLRLQIAAR